MVKWVYRTETLDGDKYRIYDADKETTTWKPINELGADGWRLVSVVIEDGVRTGYFEKEATRYTKLTGARLDLPMIHKIPHINE